MHQGCCSPAGEHVKPGGMGGDCTSVDIECRKRLVSQVHSTALPTRRSAFGIWDPIWRFSFSPKVCSNHWSLDPRVIIENGAAMSQRRAPCVVILDAKCPEAREQETC